MDDCIFCRIASGAIPSEIVLEDGTFVAFRDIQTVAPQHVLVVPREHIGSLNEIDDRWNNGEGHALLRFVVAVADRLGIRDTGYRVLANVGPDARQEVQHLHLHILGGEDLGDLR